MAVVRFPFRESARVPSSPPEVQQQHVRSLIDRLQVLALTKPAVALWLLDWMDRFLAYHTAD